MRRTRAIVIALVIVVVLSIAGTLGFLIYRPQATLDGDYRLLGLDARGEIVRDVWGVAHVYASTPHDLFYLQGYATARSPMRNRPSGVTSTASSRSPARTAYLNAACPPGPTGSTAAPRRRWAVDRTEGARSRRGPRRRPLPR